MEKRRTLSEQEQRLYFQKYQSGNQDARDILICQNIGLVYSTINREFRSYYDKEKIEYAGKIGLIHAVDHFDLKRNANFSTFATVCIRRAILSCITQGEEIPPTLSLNQLQDNSCFDDKARCLEDLLPDDSVDVIEEVEKEETYAFLYQALEKLPERTKRIIIDYFKLGNQQSHTLEELEKIYGISDTRILQIVKKGCQQLRTCLEFEYSSINHQNSSLFSCLSSEEEKIMILYLKGYSRTSIAYKLSLPLEEVSSRIKNIKQKLIYLGREEEMKKMLKSRVF